MTDSEIDEDDEDGEDGEDDEDEYQVIKRNFSPDSSLPDLPDCKGSGGFVLKNVLICCGEDEDEYNVIKPNFSCCPIFWRVCPEKIKLFSYLFFKK